MKTNLHAATVMPGPRRPALQEQLQQVNRQCTQCQRCVAECQFLKNYGDPKQIADAYDPDDNYHLGLPFECSLCGLCTAVCPDDVDPVAMFLEMRRETFERGAGDYPEHKGLQGYEKKGTSQRFSWYALPEGCDTIFFPGCGLTGTRPEQTLKTFEVLQRSVPNAGIVLDCCTKPSHDLGKEDYFLAMFGEMKQFLVEHGIKKILVACPNCDKVFSEYGPEFETRTIYEVLDAGELPDSGQVSGTVNVHDPCVSRFSGPVHDAVRSLAEKKGLSVIETRHSRETTLCCGEGGAVGCLSPELAQGWTKKRAGEADGSRTVTYCTGCAHFLGAHGPTNHILDLVFAPEDAMADKAKVSRAPFTYLNRLKVKKELRSSVAAVVTRERTFTAGEEVKGGLLKKVAILAFIIGAIVMVRATGVTEYLEQERLRALIEGYGVLAPIIYMAIYCIAPALFLPGLPISIVGAILFGPVMGVAYTIASASVGACVAFLVSRYLARGWIENKLKSPRWRHLDEQVEKHGWKMVAFTRLIPLFPFNLLNYAFGLTRVKFSHYALATFLFMLPGTIAFITFSSSLLDVIRGKISSTFLLGLGLMVLVTLMPMFHKRYKAKREARAQEAALSRPGYSYKKSLKVKTAVFAGIALVFGAGIFLVNHYFWAVNAHVYTAEFHLMFLLKNLQAANLELFTEYFKPMGASLDGFVLLLLANLFQGFWLPFSKPILVTAQVGAQGLTVGLLFSYLSMLLTGILSFGFARFLLGDIRPLLRNGKTGPPKNGRSRLMTLGLPVAAALPWLPLPVMPLLAGVLRVPLAQTSVLMGCGLLVRIAILMLIPSLFI
ncbi:MAG: VTT domain-containing protein [Desulfuromonadales bacterium]|nr:VTT domain-containing protein [Desulfuromonadales bacterium]